WVTAKTVTCWFFTALVATAWFAGLVHAVLVVAPLSKPTTTTVSVRAHRAAPLLGNRGGSVGVARRAQWRASSGPPRRPPWRGLWGSERPWRRDLAVNSGGPGTGNGVV